MNANKIMTIIGNAAIFSLITNTAAFAEPSTHKVYSSGIMVLMFLGFCALVVVAQLIPAIITLCGMIKSAVEARKLAPAKSRNN